MREEPLGWVVGGSLVGGRVDTFVCEGGEYLDWMGWTCWALFDV